MQSDPKYFNISGYGIKNFYVPVHDIEGSGEIWLGTWHLLPWTLVNASLENPDFDFDDALANSGHGVIIHFHGTGETRRDSYGMHDVLREFFHVIAFDYRGKFIISSNDVSKLLNLVIIKKIKNNIDTSCPTMLQL